MKEVQAVTERMYSKLLAMAGDEAVANLKFPEYFRISRHSTSGEVTGAVTAGTDPQLLTVATYAYFLEFFDSTTWFGAQIELCCLCCVLVLDQNIIAEFVFTVVLPACFRDSGLMVIHD